MKLIISRFSRTFGTLLQSWVPITEAIRISREVVDNEMIAKRLAVVEEGVSKGRGMSQPLRGNGVFPGIVTQMVTVGEEAGRLERTFLLIAERFEVETKDLIKRFVSLFEPADNPDGVGRRLYRCFDACRHFQYQRYTYIRASSKR